MMTGRDTEAQGIPRSAWVTQGPEDVQPLLLPSALSLTSVQEGQTRVCLPPGGGH